MKHFSPRAVIAWEQLGSSGQQLQVGTGTAQNIKDVAGQKDAFGFLIPTHLHINSAAGTTIINIRSIWRAYINKISKVLAPTGLVTCKIWDGSGNVIATIGTIDVSTFAAGGSALEINMGPVEIGAFYGTCIIGFELAGGDVNNYLVVDTGGAGTAETDLGKTRTHGSTAWDAGVLKVGGSIDWIGDLFYLYDPSYVKSCAIY